jgi:hypothetical protein
VQKIKILRLVDVFYSLFLAFSLKITELFREIKRIMPQVSPQELIGFCCQLLLDFEGAYLVTREF